MARKYRIFHLPDLLKLAGYTLPCGVFRYISSWRFSTTSMVRACRLTRITVGDVGLLALVVGVLRQGCLSTLLMALETVGWDVPKIPANACCRMFSCR